MDLLLRRYPPARHLLRVPVLCLLPQCDGCEISLLRVQLVSLLEGEGNQFLACK